MRHLIVILLLLTSSPVFTQNSPAERTKHFNLDNGTAIKGYDPVAYFTLKNAVKGSDEFSAKYQGVTYYFSSAANKSAFEANPVKYEPQYGGWCAFAMGDYGKKVEVDPETFKIIDGKLYLFYNFFFNNTLNSWNKDEKNLKGSADKNWLSMIK